MCGRKTLTKDIRSIIEELAIDEWENPEDYFPSYNISPGQRSPIVIKEGQRTVKLMKWGLAPSWSQDESIGFKMINARSETLTEKPAYQGLISKHRCVVEDAVKTDEEEVEDDNKNPENKEQKGE